MVLHGVWDVREVADEELLGSLSFWVRVEGPTSDLGRVSGAKGSGVRKRQSVHLLHCKIL